MLVNLKRGWRMLLLSACVEYIGVIIMIIRIILVVFIYGHTFMYVYIQLWIFYCEIHKCM